MASTGQVRQHLLITGRVQGVAFRWHTREAALGEGVNGWVRNLSGGRVEVVLEGEAEAVARVVGWCRRGPPSARVDEIQLSDQTPSGEREFRVLPSA